jgi:DNA (cytosine-5)-methyltransferase 1
VEIDEYCRRVLAKHFPNAERFADVRECGSHNLRPVDVICGGFPCQDISNAGRRQGLDGERSGLWSEYLRIICELRPQFVLVENVSALLHMGLGRILGELASCGYDAEWDCLPAVAFGAPHIRDRIWLLAYPMQRNGSSQPRQQQAQRPHLFGASGAGDVADAEEQSIGAGLCAYESSGERRGRPGNGGSSSNVAHSAGVGHARPGLHEESSDSEADGPRQANHAFAKYAEQWRVEPAVGRVANGVPARVDRLRSLGNAVVPQIAQWIAERIMNAIEAGA